MARDNELQAAIEHSEQGVLLRVKVVPGASRNRIVGMLGDRLKLSVSVAPEGGKANKAVCKLLAETLGVPPRDVSVSAGHTQPQKTLTIERITGGLVADRLAQVLSD